MTAVEGRQPSTGFEITAGAVAAYGCGYAWLVCSTLLSFVCCLCGVVVGRKWTKSGECAGEVATQKRIAQFRRTGLCWTNGEPSESLPEMGVHESTAICNLRLFDWLGATETMQIVAAGRSSRPQSKSHRGHKAIFQRCVFDEDKNKPMRVQRGGQTMRTSNDSVGIETILFNNTGQDVTSLYFFLDCSRLN